MSVYVNFYILTIKYKKKQQLAFQAVITWLELDITDFCSSFTHDDFDHLQKSLFIFKVTLNPVGVLGPVPYPASRPTSLWTNAMTPMPVASRPFLNHERNPAKTVKARNSQVTRCSLTRNLCREPISYKF